MCERCDWVDRLVDLSADLDTVNYFRIQLDANRVLTDPHYCAEVGRLKALFEAAEWEARVLMTALAVSLLSDPSPRKTETVH